MKINRNTFVETVLTPDEVRVILKAWWSSQRAGGIVIPEWADFQLDQHTARFSWREGTDNG